MWAPPCSALRTSRGGLGRVEARRPGPPSCREVRLPWEQLAQRMAVDGGAAGPWPQLGVDVNAAFWVARLCCIGLQLPRHKSHLCSAGHVEGPRVLRGSRRRCSILPDTHKAGTEKQATRPAQPGPADAGRAVQPPSQLHQPAPQPCEPPRSSHPPIPLSLSGASVPHPPHLPTYSHCPAPPAPLPADCHSSVPLPALL